MNIDPAAPDIDAETEYEYQYDDNESESFLVDLDLSSVNGVIRSRHAGKNAGRKRTLKAASRKKKADSDASEDDGSANGADPPSPGQEEAEDGGNELPIPHKPGTQPTSEVQVLDLASGNPIVSYENQLYSCSWTNMIGTNMFFTQPSGNQHEAPLRSTTDYDLLGVSRIKIVGQKGRLIPKAPVKKRQRSNDDVGEVEDSSATPVDGTSFPGFRSSNPKANKERRKQANFLDRLIQAKRARGETDTVITISDHKTDTLLKANTTGLSAEQKQSINELNAKVVRGDADAVASLKEIYSQLDGGGIVAPNPSLGKNDPNDIPTPNSARSDQQPNDHG